MAVKRKIDTRPIWKHDKIAYGGDYNPEQWPEEIWQEDMKLFQMAGIDTVTLNVFSWASIQPAEDCYDFECLDKIIDLVCENDMKICLATSTGAHPAWMAKRYPEILRTDFQGRKHKFGGRHNSCPNSPVYRRYAAKLAGKLAERYGSNPHIIGWHISNEFGGDCYCENCTKAFREWLKERYGTLEELNHAWNTAFWGHTFYDWDEVELPSELTEHFQMMGKDRTQFQGITIDYRRFNSESIMNCYRLEYDAIRKYCKDTPITTNLMGFYPLLDYHKWAEYMDFISWDNYPSPTDSPAGKAINHDLMRGLKGGRSFCLMEQTPSVTNWQPYNKLKRPGQMRLDSYQAVAHGADTVMFFQMRRSIGACEKYHGAIIDHAGRTDTRVFQEASTLGAELKKIGNITQGAVTPSKVALVFDWENWWGIDYSAGPSILLDYRKELYNYYEAFFTRNIPCDLIGIQDDLEGYDLVIAPVLYMVKTGYDEKIRQYVKNGGNFVTTYFSGYVNECDLVDGAYPGRLRDILGIWVEESDALMQEEENHFIYHGKTYPARILCDLIRPEGAGVLSVYEEDFYQGTPMLTVNSFGAGKAYYVGVSSDAGFYQAFVEELCRETGIEPIHSCYENVEFTIRENGNVQFLFILNHNEEVVRIKLDYAGRDLLTEREYEKEETLELPAREVKIIQLS
ncbi:MAG: beta-galactosidase [Lachnospiraceae bacterium]